MNKYICSANNNYKEEVEEILNTKKNEILDFFNVPNNFELSFDIYIYDTINDLVTGMKNRGFEDMPEYMCACYKDEDNSINLFEPKDNPLENEWSKEEYKRVIFHEEIHAIQGAIYGKQPEWLTEGVAKYLDGTYSKGIKNLLDNYINKCEIPAMEELENEFGMHEYDSYDYAYLMVSYLIETLGKNNFVTLIKDEDKVKYLSDDLVNKAVNYYNTKVKHEKYFNQDISNPEYLFHGSPKKVDKIKPQLATDSDNNKNNIAEAVFLFPSFLKATPYAFKDTIKENSKDLDWDFKIPNNDDLPLMKMENVNVDENITGYIYVFEKDDSMHKDEETYQYKCYHELIPCEVIEVKYKDFQDYYSIENKKDKSKEL